MSGTWARLVRQTGSDLLRFWQEDIGNVIAPARCINCLTAGQWLCLPCLQQRLTTPVRLACIGCDLDSRTGRICSHCQADTLLSGALWAGSSQEPWVRHGVQWLKFRGIRQLAEPLAMLVAARLSLIAPLRHLREEAAFVPVPLHPRRLRARGYDQSMELAQALSRLTQIPMIPGLARSVATVPQNQLSAHWRTFNVSEAFRLTIPLPDSLRIILLVDDVVTTGATLFAAARALASPTEPASPQRAVWGVTVGRADSGD